MNDNALPKSILFLSANPRGLSTLRLQEEEEVIKERLRLANYGKAPIYSRGAAKPVDIQQALLDFKPQIVHFSGHGAGEDGLVFEDAAGKEKLVTAEALGTLFGLFSGQVECVVLNACYSEFQAKAISQHIPYVVGMSQAIGDRAAIEFAIGFYMALGAREPYEFAFKLGCNTIQLAGLFENLTPVLLAHSSVPSKDGSPRRSSTQSIYPTPPPEKPDPISEWSLEIALNGSLSQWKKVESPLPEDPSQTRVELFRQYKFNTFSGAVEFMHKVAPGFDIALHHPRWEQVWKTVKVYLTTWDINHRISDRDIQVAKYLDKSFAEFPGARLEQ